MKSDTLTLGVLFIGGAYLLYRSDWFNPFSSTNIANKAVNTLYQQVTGSTQSPGEDIADYQYRNADYQSLMVLVDYFTKKGVNDLTKQKALNLGWTKTDIDSAIEYYNQAYPSQSVYELTPVY